MDEHTVGVVSGMSGAIMILPREGLMDHEGEPVKDDRAYYIGENSFYVPKDQNGNYKRFDDVGESDPDTLELMNGLIPRLVVFNGKAGSLTGDSRARRCHLSTARPIVTPDRT